MSKSPQVNKRLSKVLGSRQPFLR